METKTVSINVREFLRGFEHIQTTGNSGRQVGRDTTFASRFKKVLESFVMEGPNHDSF